MYGIIEFFEPSNVSILIWAGKIILAYAASYLAVWLLAFILCRLFPLGGITLRVYFAWLHLLAFHSILSMAFLLISAKYYKELGISLRFCLLYLLPVFLSGFLCIRLSMKIKGQIKKKGTIRKEAKR